MKTLYDNDPNKLVEIAMKYIDGAGWTVHKPIKVVGLFWPTCKIVLRKMTIDEISKQRNREKLMQEIKELEMKG